MDLPLEPLLKQRGILLVVRTRTPVPPPVHLTLSCQASAKVALTPIPPVLGKALVLTPLGRPQSLSQQGPRQDSLGSSSSRGYLRYDPACRADLDRDPVTQANTIANAYSPSAASRQRPG